MGRWPRKVTADRASAPETVAEGVVECRYVTQDGAQRSARFPVATQPCGALPSAPTGPLKEFEDKLKAIELRERGKEKKEISDLLGRSEHWVQRWWRQTPECIPKPSVAHGSLIKNAPLISFRDLELRRGFVSEQDQQGTSLLSELQEAVVWAPARRATRDPDTGDLKVRFDASGHSIEQPGRFVAEYKGGSARLDSLLQSASAIAGIVDSKARVFMNRYENGASTCPIHRHDFWTCMISFGASRIAMVEGRPLLLHDGDLLVFGTQAHGCPAMPDVSGQRLSVVVFFYPNADAFDRRWLTLDSASSCTTEENARRDTQQGSLKLAQRRVDADLSACPGISLGLLARQAVKCDREITIYSLGCGVRSEVDFFQALQRHSVQQIWDVRLSTSMSSNHWAPDKLARSCKARLMSYRRIPVGRAQAGGVMGHVRSEEGVDLQGRLVMAAMCASVAILGEAPDWRECLQRRVLSEALTSGRWGPVRVLHLGVADEEQWSHATSDTAPQRSPAQVSPQSEVGRANRFQRRRESPSH